MREHYDKLYATSTHYWGTLPSPVALLLLAHRKNGRVLDLCCGQGPDSIFFSNRGFDVTAIDISPVAIQQLKAENLPIDIREADMKALPQEHFDIIFSRMGLQMIEPQAREEYIRKLKITYPDAIHAHIIPIAGACFGDAFVCKENLLKVAYADWELLHFEQAWTISRVPNKNGDHYLMREERIIARSAKVSK
jgi:SAM-dependent methyltransferase